MTATDSVQNNVSFRLNGTLSTSATSVAISDDTTNGGACAFTNAQITVQSPDGNTFERMTATASAGTLTISARGIKPDQVLATDAALKREFRKGSIGYVTYMANQIVNAAGAQAVAGTWTFTNGVASGSFASDAAADAAWSGGTAPNGAMFYNTSLGRNRIKESGNWVSSTGSVDYATTRSCAPAAANNGEWYRDNTNSNALTFKNTGGTSFAFVVDATGKLATGAYDFATFANVYANDATKPLNSVGGRHLLVDYGTGADGDVTITTNVTLTRDMFYNNLTVNSSGVLDPAGYKIFVLGTLSGNGIIRRNGAVGGNATGTTAGTAGAGLAAGTLGACGAGVAGGTGGSGGGAGSATTGASALVDSFKTGTPFCAGGAGGIGNASAGGSAGFNASANTGFFVGRTFSSLFRFVPMGYSTSIKYPTLPGGVGGGGGGAYYGASTGGGGGGGGSSGGYIFISASVVSFTGTIQSNGGVGGAAGTATAVTGGCGGGGGGGGGGSGGVVFVVSSSFTFSGTLNVNGGNGGNGTNGVSNSGAAKGGGGGQGGEGGIFTLSALSYNTAGSTITVAAGTGGTQGTGAGGGSSGTVGANGGAGAQYLLTL